MIEQVRKKWEEYKELQKCHHFVYDYQLRDGNKKILFMGVNPGEDDKDWYDFPNGQCEESMHYDFRKGKSLPPNSKKWFKTINEMIPNNFGIMLSELFFWSSKNLVKLSERVPNWKNGPIMEFCVKANNWLINERNIKMIIVTEVSNIKLFSKLYNLKFIEKFFDSNNNRRLVEKFVSKDGKIWLFTLHLTSTRGFTANMKLNIKRIIHEQCENI